jgi:hypothetical protein
MEHCTIKWENLSFPTEWVIDTPRAPIPRSITSAQIKENSNSAVISFPQGNFPDLLLVQSPFLHFLLPHFVYMPHSRL